MDIPEELIPSETSWAYGQTETAQRAHLYLPAAGWGEKEGTVINSERRIGVVRKGCRAPGKALAVFISFNSWPNTGDAAVCFDVGNPLKPFFNY